MDIIYEWSLVRSGVDGQPAVAGVGVVEVDEGGDHGVPLEGEVAVVLVHRERGAGPGGLQVRLGVMLGGNSTDFIRRKKQIATFSSHFIQSGKVV